jgi:hypothetical protein
MSESQIKEIALQLSLGKREVAATIELLDGDASLPFIARYRKEATGNLDEVAIARIRNPRPSSRRLDSCASARTTIHLMRQRCIRRATLWWRRWPWTWESVSKS